MREDVAQFENMVEFDSQQGAITFCGRRAILVNTNAMGVLRHELIQTLGRDIAKVILTRYGFSCGQEDAETLETEFRPKGLSEFVMAGPRLHMIAGIAQVIPEKLEVNAETGKYHMSGTWLGSYEAEQHLHLYGPDQESVCWTLAGYASGYSSVVFNTSMICVEHKCEGRGDNCCTWSLMPADECGPEWGEIHKYFKPLNIHAHINLLEQKVKERTQALEASEQRYRELLKNLPDIAFNMDTDGRLTELNSSGRARLGISISDVPNVVLSDLLAPFEHRKIINFIRQLSRERKTNRLDVTFIDGNEEEFPAQLLIKPIVVKDVLIGYQGLAVDMAAQKARERRLSEYASRLEHREEQIYDLISDALYVTDHEGCFILVNATMARRMETTEEEAIGKNFAEFVPPSAADRINQELRLCLSGERTEPFELSLPGREGQVRIVEVSNEPLIENGKVIGVVGVARDITIRRELERRLAQSSRLAALGEFASGIAHEINNPIGLISGYAEEILDLMKDLPAAAGLPEIEIFRRGLNTIQEQAYRCKYITGNLLSFAKQQKVLLQPTYMDQLVRESVEFFIEGKQAKGIEVLVETEEESMMVDTDPNLYGQVMLNLLKNACDAMNGKGRIWVRLYREQETMILEVDDEGPGLAPDIASQIFDPFFTTKGPGAGSGLGLSICYGIVGELQGNISYVARPGGGARFRVSTPFVPSDENRFQNGR
ncbi:XylR N-terminal domain-containing protein [Sedimenticola selenatireducens]|uniref:XylR N-terminal domain-containing protein n=1 Tax=Sedimenticola selenatireducens TaxID=191960 RepID=UPI00048E6D8C|nr:XylR N-terminal domain-containing protein [Sedimenticola selenatireducens]